MKLAERGEGIEVSHLNNIDILIHPNSPPSLNESQNYSTNEINQDKRTATDDELPQKAKPSRDMTAVQTEDNASKEGPPALRDTIVSSRSTSITSTRMKSKQEIRMALNALYSEAIGNGPI